MAIFKSIKGFFGQMIHYKDGVKVGETWDGFIPGTKTHYDVNGKYVGHSDRGFLADEVHYNEANEVVGESWNGAFGTKKHYSQNGYTGHSYDGLMGTNTIIDDYEPSMFDSELDFDSEASDAFADSSDW